MIGADHKGTKPAQGVMVARPAMDPVSKPSNFGLPSRAHSITTQAAVAKDAATSVLRKAIAVILSTCNSLPALKPYHPNQSKPEPMATSGMLLGVDFLSIREPM